MDFDLRQWLLILGPVFIIAVLLHGYLRTRAGQNNIRMKLDKSFVSGVGDDVDVDDLSLLKAELPNGGARVLSGEGPDVETEEEVPVLVESVELPSLSAADLSNLPETEPEEIIAELEEEQVTEEEPTVATEPDAEAGPVVQEAADVGKAPPAMVREPVAEEPSPPPEKFVVINVLALDEPFPGQKLLELLLESGMTFGEMDIFHKLVGDEMQFSLASAVEPGTFDMKSMDVFSTPGVTLFMRVHELREPVQVLDDMLAVADAIALELGGEVRDETRSVMTPQTIEHCHQSIREFQFKNSA